MIETMNIETKILCSGRWAARCGLVVATGSTEAEAREACRDEVKALEDAIMARPKGPHQTRSPFQSPTGIGEPEVRLTGATIADLWEARLGLRIATGLSEYEAKYNVLRRYVDDVLLPMLEERDRLLRAIPECPTHGICIPHALEWVEKMKRKVGND